MKLSSLLSKKANKKINKRNNERGNANEDCPMCVVSPEVVSQLKKNKK